MIVMRSLAFFLLLLLNIPVHATHCPLPLEAQALYPQEFSDGLVAAIFEAACAQSQHFSDIGMQTLLLYYHDGTATIEDLGRDAVNPQMGRYRAVAGGGAIIVTITDDL